MLKTINTITGTSFFDLEVMFISDTSKHSKGRHYVSINAASDTGDAILGNVAVVPVTFNNSDVIRVNKKSISTINTELLNDAIALVSGSNDIFTAIIEHFVFGIDHSKAHLSKAGFYNSFDNPDDFADYFRVCSYETRRIILADHICYNHDAKMNGIISMSTYVGANKFCQARCQHCNGAICQYCYADSLTAQRANLKSKLARLHAILTSIELSIADIPVLDATIYPYFRFESFGDLNNTIQVNNYNLFASCNPDINFTLWTKNPGIIQNAINRGMILSDNLVIGLSSLYLNTPEIDKAMRYSFIRFLFTVYDDDYIKEHNIVINCGAKHCLSCGICYKYLHEFKHGLQLINERKK